MLAKCQTLFGSKVTKDDIFFYIYAVLHSVEYRKKYQSDLQKVLPRVPLVKGFFEFAEAGKELVSLHRDYEKLDTYPLEITRKVDAPLDLQKMRYQKIGRETDKTVINFNQGITISGIPIKAQEYRLGNKSALDWIVDRFQLKVEKNSNLVNDPNAWGTEHGQAEYVLSLIGKVVNLSLKTVAILESLPTLEDAE
jgi:predicted helicase